MNTLSDPLATIARVDPARAFLVTPGDTLSYREADSRVSYAADALRRSGLGPGDQMALYQPGGPVDPDDTLRSVILILAGWRLGLVVVPLSGRLPPATVLPLLDQIGGAALVGADGLNPQVLTEGADAPAELSMWRLAQPATVIFTSGTAGAPKAALHTLGNHVWSALGWHERMPLSARDRWLLDLPLHHVGGVAVLMRCVLAGASLSIPVRGAPLNESVGWLGATRASLVATQLRRALRANGELPTLGMLLLGGSDIPPELLRQARSRGWPVVTSYGLTEMASTVAATPPDAPDAALATAGYVLPHREVQLSPDGEILVRGATRFAGYVTPTGLAQPFDDDGWFATGDLGEWQHIGADSMLRVLGRKDNRFVSGGENVQPEAIEAVLLAREEVSQAVVVPVPHEEFGERPVAFVDADRWEPEAWREAVAEALPRFMVPDAFHPWPEAEGGGNGRVKPSRAELARLAQRA